MNESATDQCNLHIFTQLDFDFHFTEEPQLSKTGLRFKSGGIAILYWAAWYIIVRYQDDIDWNKPSLSSFLYIFCNYVNHQNQETRTNIVLS